MLFEKSLISPQPTWRAQRDACIPVQRPLTPALSHEGRGCLLGSSGAHVLEVRSARRSTGKLNAIGGANAGYCFGMKSPFTC